MASSSNSSVEKGFKYDVFLSFRGEDTRNNFVGHLYEALQRNSIETYKDDQKIEKGERINDQLLKSIEDSRFYIIVFSKNYASSSWCLDELVKIMECQKKIPEQKTAYPVFFDVEPTHVRKQNGPVGEAFSKHENQEAVGKWRDAMKKLADLAGDESKLIQIIVDVIFKKKYSTNSSADGKLVGMETRIRDVLSSLEIGTEDVRMIGIKGMGGGGKTTLARAIYDLISNHFEGKSFVDNVKEVSKPSLSGLKKLQKRILKDVLNKKDIIISSVHDGKSMLKDMMSRRKTLVVLDDVDCIEQLEALAGEPNWFKSGSRLIITTRDEQVLLADRVNFVHDVNLLSPTEAICLFSRYAFYTEIPTRGYEELSGQVVQYANGLPLTIKVLGSFLCNKKESEWIDAIKRLKTIPLRATLERLEISFDGLEDDYKEIFLDIACILKGSNKKYAIRVLESRGFHAKVGLRVLEQKCLITYNAYGELWMHDHLEEMGRNIVRRSHPNEPNKHSRLWIREEIEHILTNDLGTPATQCLWFNSPGFSAEIAVKGLAKMKDLKVLHNVRVLFSNDIEFDRVSEYLPSSLRFMRWNSFPFSNLPNTFQGKYLVDLEMENSNILQLWEDGKEKVLNNLRFLRIELSMLRTFDLRLAPNLEQLSIDYCRDFVELHVPVDHRLKLEYLQIYSSKLTNLHLGNTQNLKTLKLQGCHDLVELEISQCLKLEHLDLSHSKLTNLHLGNTPNLEKLVLNGCNDLVELQMQCLKLKKLNLSLSKLKTIHLGSTPNLEELVLDGCNDLIELEMPAECLKLALLDLSHSKLKTIHLGSTPNLDELVLDGCNDLVELQMQCLKLKKLNLSLSKLMTIHLGSTLNLEKLILKGCNDLVKLQMPSECLKLRDLNLSHSKLRTIHLGSTPNLEDISIYGCNDLVELQMPSECLKLKDLNLSHSKLKTIHLGITPNLEKLILKGCNDLVELQMPSECLKLRDLNLSHSKLRTLDLGLTPNIKWLDLEKCYDLVELEMPSESLKLEVLNLSHSKLRTLDLGLTPNLKKLNLEKCHYLVDFKARAGCLRNLAFLDLSGCGRFKYFVFDKWSLPGCLSELHLIAEPTDVCPLHSDNDSPKFQFSCYYKEHRASSFGNLERIISLGLCPCTSHESFSRSICCLQGIKKLTLEGCITEAPRDLDQLEHLKCLEIKSCWLLEKLPDDIGRLESLETLIITDCKLLQDIPNSICKMKRINSFDLRGCIRVVELPEEIGCLESLKELNIEGTGITHLPQSIFKLRGLRIVGSIRLIDTHGLLLKRRRTCDDDEIVYYI